jgi:hypothetical protein
VAVAAGEGPGGALPLPEGDALAGAVGAPEALALALTRALADGEPEARALLESRGEALAEGDTMEAVAEPDAGGELLAALEGDADGEPLGEPLRDALALDERVRRLGVAETGAEPVRALEALPEGVEEPLREGEPLADGLAVERREEDTVAQVDGEAVRGPDRDAERQREKEALVVGDTVGVLRAEGDAELQALAEPLRDAEGEAVPETVTEGEAVALGERDWDTLAVKLGECDAEAEKAPDAVGDTLGDTETLPVAEGDHVPPQPM